jgi:MOSC domain-containing protein
VSARVAAILVTPVKGLRVQSRAAVEVGPGGVADDRRFLLIDDRGRMVNAKRHPALVRVAADYRPEGRTLALSLPGRTVEGEVAAGPKGEVAFYSSAIAAREVPGPWSAALSELVGTPLRLVEADPDRGAVDRGPRGAVTIVSSASVQRLAAEAEPPDPLDARRFRMTFELDGLEAHAEDEWVGRPVRIGEALVEPGGHVGRCLVTSLDPESGVRDVETLDLLARYRREAETTEPLACGVYARVLQPGMVRLGDAAAPL